MNRTYEITRLVNDLAGHWTEPVLTILKAAGMPRISVDMEIETWRTLRSVLERELLRQPLLVDEILRQPAARSVLKPLRQTDYLPRLRAVGAHG